jgi:flagellin-like protein
MLKKNRGISGIIVAIIMIALVLIAAGILWAVIGKLLEGQEKDILGTQKCLGIQIEPTGFDCDNPYDNCSVHLKRATGSTEQVTKVGITFSDEDESVDEYLGEVDNIPAIRTITNINISDNDISNNLTKVTVRWFVEVEEEDFPCPGSTTFEKSE